MLDRVYGGQLDQATKFVDVTHVRDRGKILPRRPYDNCTFIRVYHCRDSVSTNGEQCLQPINRVVALLELC